MALTTTQRAAIRRYLGFPDVNRQIFGNDALEQTFDALTPEGEVEVVALLAKLATIDATLESSWSRQKVIKAEEVTLAGDGELRALNREGARLASQLADHLGITKRRNVFSSGSRGGPAIRG